MNEFYFERHVAECNQEDYEGKRDHSIITCNFNVHIVLEYDKTRNSHKRVCFQAMKIKLDIDWIICEKYRRSMDFFYF